MATQKIGLEAVFDITKFTSSANSYKRELVNLNTATTATANSVARSGSAFRQAAAAVGVYGAALAKLAAIANTVPQAMRGATDSVKKNSKAMKKAGQSTQNYKRELGGLSEATQGASRGLKTAGGGIRDYKKEIESLEQTTIRSKVSLEQTGSSIGSIGAIAGGAAVAGVAALTVGLVALADAGVSVSISQEAAFASVSKVVDGLATINADGLLELTDAGQAFDDSLDELSKTIPQTFETLAQTAGLGAQLGITVGLDPSEAQDTLIKFTESISRTAISTGIDEEQLALELAQITNIFQASVGDRAENVGQLGSTIVELGNKTATTERQILNFAANLAGAGNAAGFTQDEVLGISAALASVGVNAEAGGTAFSKAISRFDILVKNSGKSFIDNTASINQNNEAITALKEKLSSAQADLVRTEAQTGLTGQSLLDQRQAFLEAGGAAEDWGRQLGDSSREGLFNTAKNVEDLRAQIQGLEGAQRDLISTQGQAVNSNELGKLFEVASKDVETFNKLGIKSLDDFTTLVKSDSSKALELFVNGLGKVVEEGGNVDQVLKDVGLGTDVRLVSAFKRLAGAGSQLSDALEISRRGWEENNAAVKESEQRFATIESKLQILKNVGVSALDTIGDKVLEFAGPVLVDAIDNFSEFTEVFDTFVSRIEIADFTNLLPDLDFSAIADGLSTSIQAIAETLGEITIPESVGGLAAVLGFAPETVGLINQVSSSLTDLFGLFTSFDLEGLAAFDFGSLLGGFIEGVSGARNEILTGLSNALTPLIEGFVGFVNSPEFISGIDAMTTAIADLFVTGVTTSFEELPELAGVLTNLVLKIGTGLAAVGGVLVLVGADLAVKIVQGFVEYFTGDELEVATVAELINTLGRVTDLTIPQFLEAFNSIGLEALKGLAAGFELGATVAIEGILAIGAQIINSFKEFFGIASPSTLFAEFGLNIIQGLAAGIINSASLVTTALTSTIGQSIASFGEGLQLPELGLSELLTGGDESTGGEAGGIFEFAKGIKDGLGSALEETGDIVSATVAPAFEDVGAATGLFSTEASESANVVNGQLSPALSRVGSIAGATTAPALKTASDAIQQNTNQAQKLASILNGQLNSASETFAELWERIGSNAEDAIEPLTEVKNLLGEIASFLQAIQAAGGGSGAQGAAAAGGAATAGATASGAFQSFNSVRNNNTNNTFNLTVNSSQASRGVIGDFGRLQALV